MRQRGSKTMPSATGLGDRKQINPESQGLLSLIGKKKEFSCPLLFLVAVQGYSYRR